MSFFLPIAAKFRDVLIRYLLLAAGFALLGSLVMALTGNDEMLDAWRRLLR